MAYTYLMGPVEAARTAGQASPASWAPQMAPSPALWAPQMAPGPKAQADQVALRAAWDRNSAARARAGLAPYVESALEAQGRAVGGTLALTAWLDAETASLTSGGVKTRVQAVEEQKGFPVLAVVGGLLAVMFLMKGK